MKIENYVSTYLENCSIEFLHDVLDHGIFNTGADVLQGNSAAEYELIAAEFNYQAVELLAGSGI